MNARLLLSLCVCCLGSLLTQLRAEEPQPVPAEEIRAAVEKGLGFLEEAGTDWVEQRDCVSCHQIPSLIWSYNEAARRGIRPNEERRRHWQQWGADWHNFMAPENRDENTRESTLDANTETLSFLILGRDEEENPEPPWVQEFRDHLRKTQQKDGSWKPQGQVPLQKRSLRESTEVTTRWASLALGGDGRSPEQLKAGNYLQDIHNANEPIRSVSTEWYIQELLTGHWHVFALNYSRLVGKQRPDGGWGWLADGDSDAFGTGLVLYGVLKTGIKPDAAVHRGARYLLSTQQPDGSWKVPSTRKKDNSRINETATSWGTAWAVIGLCQLLPEEPGQRKPGP